MVLLTTVLYARIRERLIGTEERFAPVPTVHLQPHVKTSTLSEDPCGSSQRESTSNLHCSVNHEAQMKVLNARAGS